MAIILKPASAGTLESSDAFVQIEPGTNGLELTVESVVAQQYGPEIEAAIRDVLNELEIAHAVVHVMDRGALDCVLRARVEAAVLRGKGEV